jgi:hypothetical protein
MVTTEEVELANQRGNEMRKGPTVVSARYDGRIGRVVLVLSTGLEVMFTPRSAEGLERAKPAQLDTIEITPSGLGIHFPKLDADLYLPALLEGTMGSGTWSAAQMGGVGGSVKSAAKAAAARKNGVLGGRPRKTAVRTSGQA